MIILKNEHQLQKMREAGRISQLALLEGGKHVEPGITTADLDHIMHEFIVRAGAKPSFLGYGGFPATACISVNNEVIHGIPDKKHKIQNGDIVSIDVGAIYEGFNGDNAWTFPAGTISDEAQALLDATRESLFEGIRAAKPGNRVGDIGHAVQSYVEARGFSVVRPYVGHGVGEDMHEEPDVPNYGRVGHGARLVPGMVIAIEPMINQGAKEVRTLQNGWTVTTVDGSLSAHFEHTVAITENGPVILTAP
ncbi:type I methionyl aminopeptidase [Ethanoligenens harbinense]|uniref:Methionine aminopeptidase n=1 Tax=Ethanoligenens harbinense (strain DSM 18485 / JCM 12961 / CGMCC 1.5033 / YUAN-3) TaxID=663278 RepID=E6U8I3_ETHHY|nr:type I methionyl aminopeptidase [Ethanoligenens harbinense]ADU25974.1 methionine aminopeptidase, type I [Ethanoligenens harbinense YUAN-3]AVQ95125.1 type I methionyl aminopeptidase [Ethanoligenens harbinense YUAN-3]AYF37816.1 type I methionyl aminopeptidase [Ethanoligenens harbinense]AYF40538.1 type I methionyl aminopeptidase [Ethanoligenens harbinense]QCN91371.1 type I methionyl aminopeptidase [Ethanoligenens harbinense]